jgi:hypothetical protein
MDRLEGTMTAKEFNAALGRLDLSVYASAPALGISLRQAQRYSREEAPVPQPIAKLLRLALRAKLTREELRDL